MPTFMFTFLLKCKSVLNGIDYDDDEDNDNDDVMMSRHNCIQSTLHPQPQRSTVHSITIHTYTIKVQHNINPFASR